MRVVGNNPPRDLDFSPGEKAYWLTFRKDDCFEVPGNLPPQRLGFFFWREGVLAHFRKDDYFQVLEKRPGDVGFPPPAKRRTSSFSDKMIIPKCREKEPEDLGFICPALRTKVSAPVCFSRPPRTRRKPRCDHIRDPLRDGTFFAAPTDSRVRCTVCERPGQSA